MTDATQLESQLDQACIEYFHFHREHPHEDVDDHIGKYDAIVERIVEQPLRTFGDLRLYAKALHCCYDGDEQIGRLLEKLKALPERIWDEPLP